ncbi:MAG: NAD(P)-dependent oxidoreductase [Deltaproteobacteria bacterium]|nr:NAD(P)-dependent oxidoreductase [Deltaproteobacteria bacterium]
MKILFTGGSSFTGYWFVAELARAGHEVVSVFRRGEHDYDGVRRARVAGQDGISRRVFNCAFGDARFLELIESGGRWDLLCHHAADVTNYKSPDFDVAAALANNTRAAGAVLGALAAGDCKKVLLTGSVFEQGEGCGSEDLRAFSPYGLSKGLTAEVFRYHAATAGMRLGKFVIPNPFGPFEEPRFTAYLVKTWLGGGTAVVKTPAYVRDNIHVTLLARAYARFAADLPDGAGSSRLSPSGYPESQGAFTLRFAKEMRPRLRVPCEVELVTQTEFLEPRVRIGKDLLDAASLEWSETEAWDRLAAYYLETHGPARGRT